MKRALTLIFLGTLLPCTAAAAGAGMAMDHKQHALFIDQLEWQGASTFSTEIEGWYGDELDKIVYGIDSEKTGDHPSETELTLGWQIGISPFWDVRLEARHDRAGGDNHNWYGAGITGTLPYFIHFSGSLLTGESDTLVNIELEHDLPLSTHWAMHSKLELEAVTGEESGVEEIEFGIRFHYETVSRWSAYAGVEWSRSPMENEQRTALVTGFSYWF